MSGDFLDEAALWLGQAQEDFETAKELARSRPYMSCFCAQQSADKALKALYAIHGWEVPRMHSVAGLLQGLRSQYSALSAHQDGAALLDTFYIATRYPTISLGVVPARTFTAKNAEDAVAAAERILRECEAIFGGGATSR